MSPRLAEIAAQTVQIVQSGHYVSPSGVDVSIAGDVARAVAGTRLHLPTETLAIPGQALEPRIEVTPESTLEAGRRLGPGTAVLVFASARNPGGGFLRGAKAQEEEIARASALHACLLAAPGFYEYHRRSRDLRYSDRIIYSPDVPVFRGAGGVLLEQPYGLCLLTAAAPNLGAILGNQPALTPTVPGVLSRRAERVLRVAAAHGHRQIVLGAWGCGVFRNSPPVVASAFRAALAAVPHFERVTFAILDPTGDGPTLRAFADTFSGADQR